ncbi:MAG: 5-formyltetrahydrofolate cyclo-ligase, partial [Monoglobaceae bacterium]
GISEPRWDMVQSGVIHELRMPELVIVPAIAFDLRRQRMGYGGGYYDRYLSEYVGFSVGLAYSECITECLPTDEYDRCADAVICPERMI